MQFYTDGHRVLNDAISKRFIWYKNKGIILDWYHLVKKCKELLSMGMKGQALRSQVLREILPCLWHGLTDTAINYLTNMPAKDIKNQDKIDKLISYFERNRGYIPCYAIRKRLGLCNSSAIGEKMNDLLVSKRQKHNGMSWSKEGSVAPASITAIKRNNLRVPGRRPFLIRNMQEHHYIFFSVCGKIYIPNISRVFLSFRNISCKPDCRQSNTAFFPFLNYILGTWPFILLFILAALNIISPS